MYMEEVDNQPIAATFFNEGKWLTEFITPQNLDVCSLYKQVTCDTFDKLERITRLRAWVTDKVEYKPFISGTLRIENHTQTNRDVWMSPAMVIRTRVGNCANKAFLLTSLLRQEFPDSEVFCVFGNLHNNYNPNSPAGGHAWVQVLYEDEYYILETTTKKVPPMVLAETAKRYEAVHLFNDNKTYVIPGRTALQPFSAVYSKWLENYLDMAYIEGTK